ncbi:MAG: phosphoribosylanthranilate isomerase [Planctomycetales bacterium]|nr:phosphoribosylanthranilate isomerase [Planctomycetales bacterium]
MFRIKICGVTTIDDARLVGRAGADAVGLNFYPSSPRYLAAERALGVAQAIPGSVSKVGLFVNADETTIIDAWDRLSLDYIQLHGDETPEYVARLAPRRVIRALRVGPAGLAPVFEFLDRCREMGCTPAAVLLDAYDPHARGGTGKQVDWHAVSEYTMPPDSASLPPLVLAGGLHPENVAEAIHLVRPQAVDVASGVELSPGVKHPALVTAFVQAARRGFAAL